MGRNSSVEIEGEIEHETDLAYLFNDGDQEVWLPKSQCEWDERSQTMIIPEWLAKAKELI